MPVRFLLGSCHSHGVCLAFAQYVGFDISDSPRQIIWMWGIGSFPLTFDSSVFYQSLPGSALIPTRFLPGICRILSWVFDSQ